MPSPKKKLFVVDGSGFIFRAYHALPPLTRPDGMPVGAVYGFCNMLLRLTKQIVTEEGADSLVIVFDAGRKTFRQKIYPDYKANRPPPPEDLIPQFDLIRQACQAFNIPAVELEGYEADDIIASYATQVDKDAYEIVIVSSDKDLMQLVVDGQVSMLDPLKEVPIRAEQVQEKFGVPPDQVIEVQALAGDASDNVPGVPGIGIKTAAQLINIYGTLEVLLENLSEIKQPKRRQTLEDNMDKARVSKELVTLERNVPLPLEVDVLALKPFCAEALPAFLKEQGFTRLVKRVEQLQAVDPKAPPITALPKESQYVSIHTKEALDYWVQLALEKKVVAIDTETTSLDAMQAELVGISLAVADGQACYIPVGHTTGEPQLDRALVLETLHPLLNDPCVLKVGHNIKYDLVILSEAGVELSPMADTMLMSYVLNAGRHTHGMDALARLYLDYTTITFSSVAGKGKNQKTFDQVPVTLATPYAAEDADITLQLYHIFEPRLIQARLVRVYERIERPLISVIANMEKEGILVDQPLLERLGVDFAGQISQVEAEIYQLAGEDFNIASTKQLSHILFDKLGLPFSKKTKTGNYVTDASVLEDLKTQGFELPEKILRFRALAKLKSTYIEGLLAAINPKTHRIHTSYAMATASTGRLASTDPNLQNIPVRTEEGRKIRQAFIASKGHTLVSLDYSQIELRLLAHMADVKPLISGFKKGLDIHRATAAKIFATPEDQVTSTQRHQAKAINFGIIYGISPYGLSMQLGITQADAKKIIEDYFSHYPGIKDYVTRMHEVARQHGYVETLMGRRCATLGIQDRNPVSRQAAERQAINAPLQGSNADIIKRAMGQIPQKLAEQNLMAKLLLQVHDELIFEVPDAEVPQTIELLKYILETVVDLQVPLTVDVRTGKNWKDLH